MKKCYYAHPLSLYGTPQEQRDVLTLGELGFEVLNPNSFERGSGYQDRGMDYFYDLIQECDCLAFRSFPGGDIPSGVVGEIQVAQNFMKPVFELPTAILRRGLDLDQTREFLSEIGQR